MKKLLTLIFVTITFNLNAALPNKYVKIATPNDGSYIIYGNIKDDYIQGNSAWIVYNYKNFRSKIQRYTANCQQKTLSSREYVLYSRKDLQGKVLKQGNLVYFGNKVIPDSVGDAILNFICYAVY